VPYTQDKPFAVLFDRGPTERVAQRITKRVGKRITDEAAHLTPVAVIPAGMSLTQFEGSRGRTPGRMKRGWKTGSVEEQGDHFGIDSYTEDPEAPHVEWDTHPHVIRPSPKRLAASVIATGKPRRSGTDPQAALRYWSGGHPTFAREVHHPGTRGVHMMRDALTLAEATWLEHEGRLELDVWVRDMQGLG
jgi:hypothetical protein